MSKKKVLIVIITLNMCLIKTELMMDKIKVFANTNISNSHNAFPINAIIQDTLNNPKNINYIIIGMIFIVLILIAATLQQFKK